MQLGSFNPRARAAHTSVKSAVGKTGILAIAFAALAIGVVSAGTVSSGNTGWNWSNPLPQGNTILTADAVNNRVYAAGANGTVLRSDNGGTEWTGVRSGILDDIKLIRTIGPDSFVFAARLCAASLRQWRRHGSTTRVGTERRHLPRPRSHRSISARTRSASCCSPTARCWRRPTAARRGRSARRCPRRPSSAERQSRATCISQPPMPASCRSATRSSVRSIPEIPGLQCQAAWCLRRQTPDSPSNSSTVSPVSPRVATTSSSARPTAARRWTQLPTAGGPTSTTGGPDEDLGRVSCSDAQNCMIATLSGTSIFRTTDGGADVGFGQPVEPADLRGRHDDLESRRRGRSRGRDDHHQRRWRHLEPIRPRRRRRIQRDERPLNARRPDLRSARQPRPHRGRAAPRGAR